HDFVVMRVWAGLALVTALGPLCFWWVGRLRGDGEVPAVTSEGDAESAGVEGRVGERSPA
ncbi:hypothetical protein ACPCTO_07735, partial [Streptomyces olivoreticuli]